MSEHSPRYSECWASICSSLFILFIVQVVSAPQSAKAHNPAQIPDMLEKVLPAIVGVSTIVPSKAKEGETKQPAGTASGSTAAGQAKPDAKAVSFAGLTVIPLTQPERVRFKISRDISGVLIANIAPGNPTADRRLKPGNVVIEVGQQRVLTPGDVYEAVSRLQAEGRKAVLLLVLNKSGDQRFVALKTDGPVKTVSSPFKASVKISSLADVQATLKSLGYDYDPSLIDSKSGGKIKRAIRAFQKKIRSPG